MKRKLFSAFFALVLVFTLGLVTAMPAAAQGAPIGDPFFTTDGLGEAGWSTEQKVSGDYSAKLWIPADDGELPYDEARVVFNYDGDLNSIEGVSYPSYVIGGNDGALYPSVVLAVDLDGGGTVDSWVVQFTPLDSHTPLENDWETISFDDGSPVHVAGTRTGLPDLTGDLATDRYAPYTTDNTLTDTLGSLKAEWGDFAVLEVKAYIGEFTNLAEPGMTAYVDDITINDVLYELEPSSTVGLVAELEGITAVSVTPTSIDFGTITPGTEVSGDAIFVENIGTVVVDVTAALGRSGTVFEYLELADISPPRLWTGIIGLAVGTTADPVTTSLDVPEDYSAIGKETNTLIFTVRPY